MPDISHSIQKVLTFKLFLVLSLLCTFSYAQEEPTPPSNPSTPLSSPGFISIGSHLEWNNQNLPDHSEFLFIPCLKLGLNNYLFGNLGYAKNSIDHPNEQLGHIEHSYFLASIHLNPLVLLNRTPYSNFYIGSTYLRHRLLRNSEIGDETRIEWGLHFGQIFELSQNIQFSSELEYRTLEPYRPFGQEKYQTKANQWQFHLGLYYKIF